MVWSICRPQKNLPVNPKQTMKRILHHSLALGALLSIAPVTMDRMEAASGGGNSIGSPYCGPVAESLQNGLLQAVGSTSVADNDVTLIATGLPNHVIGYFLVGETQAFVPSPAGSQGDLCLGGKLGRFNRPDQVRDSGTVGQYSLTLDLNDFPMNPSQTVFAGETWYFQSWYRLPVTFAGGNSDSDFTSALEISFF